MAKKTFKDEINDPALAFISEQSIRNAEPDAVGGAEEVAAAPEDSDAEATELIRDGKRLRKPPEGYYIDPRYREARSARLQLLVQPSLKAKLKKKAKKEHKSINDLAHGILEKALEDI